MIPLVFIGGLAALTAYTYYGQNLVSAEEAKRLIKDGKIKRVIDVRTTVEYRAGHYPKALHIPVDKINEKQLQNFPSEDCSSTATLGNGPDMQQRNYRISDSKMFITSPGFTPIYFNTRFVFRRLPKRSASLHINIVT